MANGYSVVDLMDFLDHASDKGLMPAATATALAVASRNVLDVLDPGEREDISQLDLDAAIRRFNNKRARDFNPSSLKEYARRVKKAVELFRSWREDPANFSVRTRASTGSRKRDSSGARVETTPTEPARGAVMTTPPVQDDSYQSAFPIRPGRVVTLFNLPHDLTPAEAERLAAFVRMLAIT